MPLALFLSGLAVAAVITAMPRVLAPLIPWHVEQVSRDRKKALNIAREYTYPLASSAIELFRRLDEVLRSKARSHFLLRPDLSDYASYKNVTTLYRLGALLGWIYSFRRERFFFPRERSVWHRRRNRKVEEVETSIDLFRAALADGTDVEALRVRELAELWSINLCDKDQKDKDQKLADIAAELDLCIDTFLFENGRVKMPLVLPDNKKLELCRQIHSLLSPSSSLAGSTVDGLLEETAQGAMKVLDIQEHWIFRDWQDMIGSRMVTKTDVGPRMFDVIDLVEFKKHIARDPQPEWVGLLMGLFEGIDLHDEDAMNVRRTQVCEIHRATAKIILALRDLDKHIVRSEFLLARLQKATSSCEP